MRANQQLPNTRPLLFEIWCEKLLKQVSKSLPAPSEGGHFSLSCLSHLRCFCSLHVLQIVKFLDLVSWSFSAVDQIFSTRPVKAQPSAAGSTVDRVFVQQDYYSGLLEGQRLHLGCSLRNLSTHVLCCMSFFVLWMGCTQPYLIVLLCTTTIKADCESKASADNVVSIKKKLNVYMTHLVTSDGLLPELTSHLVVVEKLSMKCFI